MPNLSVQESPPPSSSSSKNLTKYWKQIVLLIIVVTGLAGSTWLLLRPQELRRQAAEAPEGSSTTATFTWTINNTKAPAVFNDVPESHTFYNYIQALYYHGITSGCKDNPPLYCPGDRVLRDQMALFLLRSIEGSDYIPPMPTGTVFNDVPRNYWAAGWIEELSRRGITSGCSVNPPLYCPEKSVLRDQMAVFLLKSIEGSNYIPPAPTGTVFNDVPRDYWAASWIEELSRRGITSGCSVNPPLYCPGNQILREQMAAFLVRGFEMKLTEP